MAVTTGIYVIQNTENRKVYVGSSCDVRRRWNDHLRELRQGVHGNDYLQKSYALHGEPAFRFWVAEECPRARLTEREQWWLDMFEPWDPERGYNIREDVEGRYVPNTTTLAKMSLSQRLRFCDPDQRRAISDATKGKPKAFTAEHRAFLSAATTKAWTGRKHTESTKAKMSAARKGKQPWLGKRHSDETRLKISEAKRGRVMPESEKAKRRGRTPSAEARAKASAALRLAYAEGRHARKTGPTGRKRSEETRNRIRDAIVRSWAPGGSRRK